MMAQQATPQSQAKSDLKSKLTIIPTLNSVDFELSSRVSVSKRGYRSVPLQRTNGCNLILMTSAPAKCPFPPSTFGEGGKQKLPIQLDEEDVKHIIQFQDKITKQVIAKKSIYFPKCKKLTDDEITDSMYSLIKKGKEKKDGGCWPSSITMNLPDQDSKCDDIIDSEGHRVDDYQNLAGKSVDRLVFEITGLFFIGPRAGWGFVKVLKAIKLGEPQHKIEFKAFDYTEAADQIMADYENKKKRHNECLNDSVNTNTSKKKAKKN